jgi:anti-sigma B factor antagonist
MNYSFKKEDDVLVATITAKRATVEFSGALKEALIKQIDDGAHNVVVDLSQTEFIDSSFLGTLVAGLKKATMMNGDLKVVGLQESVKSIFELTRLYRIFDIFDNKDTALKSF